MTGVQTCALPISLFCYCLGGLSLSFSFVLLFRSLPYFLLFPFHLHDFPLPQSHDNSVEFLFRSFAFAHSLQNSTSFVCEQASIIITYFCFTTTILATRIFSPFIRLRSFTSKILFALPSSPMGLPNA